ncbi:MAG: sigma-70 family RNA polymerase sigma factor [Lawsonibacter sp.]|nr:sigma-70 family RNA polymerase sigma factor [Lawsonibacter sp.]
MEDRQIIELYWKRAEEAIRETSIKYGRLCQYIAQNILSSPEDSEECVNDTWLGLWNAIPPQRPERFSAFVGRIVRNLALKRFDYLTAAKRSEEAVCSLEELEDCVSGRTSVEDEVENQRVEAAIDDFLWSLGAEKRTVFIRRYWYFDSIEHICRHTGYSPSKVKSMLYHTRQKLREFLESEDIEL